VGKITISKLVSLFAISIYSAVNDPIVNLARDQIFNFPNTQLTGTVQTTSDLRKCVGRFIFLFSVLVVAVKMGICKMPVWVDSFESYLVLIGER
jgi:hypothetical protein